MVWFLGILALSFVIGTLVLMVLDPREPAVPAAKSKVLIPRLALRPAESGLRNALDGGVPMVAASGAHHLDNF
ncbi:MAG: hypothetical protein WCF85_11800 [Rhodospirillaceae bacterium]